MSDNVYEGMNSMLAVVMFGAAIALSLFLAKTLSGSTDYAAANVDEKQSIHVTNETIDTLPAHRTEVTVEAAEAYSTIISADEAVTEVRVNGHAVTADDITAAKGGDERAAMRIRNLLGNGKYTVRGIWDTGSDGDVLARIEIRSA